MAEPAGLPADLKAHESTYFSMINVMKYGAIVCFVLAFLVIWLIS